MLWFTWKLTFILTCVLTTNPTPDPSRGMRLTAHGPRSEGREYHLAEDELAAAAVHARGFWGTGRRGVEDCVVTASDICAHNMRLTSSPASVYPLHHPFIYPHNYPPGI